MAASKVNREWLQRSFDRLGGEESSLKGLWVRTKTGPGRGESSRFFVLVDSSGQVYRDGADGYYKHFIRFVGGEGVRSVLCSRTLLNKECLICDLSSLLKDSVEERVRIIGASLAKKESILWLVLDMDEIEGGKDIATDEEGGPILVHALETGVSIRDLFNPLLREAMDEDIDVFSYKEGRITKITGHYPVGGTRMQTRYTVTLSNKPVSIAPEIEQLVESKLSDTSFYELILSLNLPPLERLLEVLKRANLESYLGDLGDLSIYDKGEEKHIEGGIKRSGVIGNREEDSGEFLGGRFLKKKGVQGILQSKDELETIDNDPATSLLDRLRKRKRLVSF